MAEHTETLVSSKQSFMSPNSVKELLDAIGVIFYWVIQLFTCESILKRVHESTVVSSVMNYLSETNKRPDDSQLGYDPYLDHEHSPGLQNLWAKSSEAVPFSTPSLWPVELGQFTRVEDLT